MTVPDPPKRRGAPASDPRRETPTIQIWNLVAPALASMSREQLAAAGHALNKATPGLKGSPPQPEDVLLNGLEHSTELPEMLTHYRFSGLDPSACLLVALLRFVQAEQYYAGDLWPLLEPQKAWHACAGKPDVHRRAREARHGGGPQLAVAGFAGLPSPSSQHRP
jgi:hypothetical protein